MYETSYEMLVFCLIGAHPEMGFPDSRYPLSAFSVQQKPGRQRVRAER
jgi:hypothetical protein